MTIIALIDSHLWVAFLIIDPKLNDAFRSVVSLGRFWLLFFDVPLSHPLHPIFILRCCARSLLSILFNHNAFLYIEIYNTSKYSPVNGICAFAKLI